MCFRSATQELVPAAEGMQPRGYPVHNLQTEMTGTRVNLEYDTFGLVYIRGTVKLERYNIRNASTSGSRSCFYTSDESYQCPLSYGV